VNVSALTRSIRAIAALKELLPAETMKHLNTTSVNHETGDNDELAFVDAVTGEVAGKFGGVAYGLPGSIIRASRDALRSYLWNANGLPVSPHKNFTRYVEDDTGVTAFFKDGSSLRGSILVGADGAHSHVRDQLLGEAAQKPEQSQYVPIFGEHDLTPAQYEPLRDIANAVVLGSTSALRLQIGMLTMKKDRSSAHYFWALMLRPDDPVALADWVQNASSQELYDFAVKSSEHLHPSIENVVKDGGQPAMNRSQPKFLELVTPETLPTGRVTILGDSAHCMVPLRGAGANTAILDACDLGKLLIEAKAESRGFQSVVAPYVAKMIPRGREAVISSRAAGNADADDPFALIRKFARQKEGAGGEPS
jgi:2-polyprenyl-6-methoxyphenol hydroxylase-like FAD-dependent oxidoreductase